MLHMFIIGIGIVGSCIYILLDDLRIERKERREQKGDDKK